MYWLSVPPTFIVLFAIVTFWFHIIRNNRLLTNVVSNICLSLLMVSSSSLTIISPSWIMLFGSWEQGRYIVSRSSNNTWLYWTYSTPSYLTSLNPLTPSRVASETPKQRWGKYMLMDAADAISWMFCGHIKVVWPWWGHLFEVVNDGVWDTLERGSWTVLSWLLFLVLALGWCQRWAIDITISHK